MRHFILGTAGHVDHGKTELVKALTGRDTDRLKEEKERGISIELGFAPLRLAEDVFLGIVDVPGHERFIKNMVAGAGGIDLAMLLVAADEGVMPQTKEHLQVLVSLGVKKGLVVISKKDLAEPDILELLKNEIADLVKGTFLESADVVATSARTGEGLDELKAKLLETCRSVEERSASGPFRLPVDRVFIRSGIGIVVTGSCYSGFVGVGDELELLPKEKIVRVREIQSFNEKLAHGRAGERLAVALRGAKSGDIERGDILATPGAFRSTYMVDTRVAITPYNAVEVKNRERVRIHHGSREVFGRIVLLYGETMRSGESGFAQLRLESPIVCERGDRFVIRRYSPPCVLGGGVILDPSASKHKMFDERVIEHLEFLEKGDERARIVAMVKGAGIAGVPVERIGCELRKRVVEDESILEIGGTLFHSDILCGLKDKIAELTERFAAEHPLLFGVDREELRQRLGGVHPKNVFTSLLEYLAEKGEVAVRGSRVRARGGGRAVSAELERRVSHLEAVIKRAGMSYLSEEDLEVAWGEEQGLQQALVFLREEGRIERVGERGYVHVGAIGEAAAKLAEFFGKRERMSVGDFKAMFGLTRKHAVPLLELMDEKQLTQRRGDNRMAGPKLGEMASGRESEK